MKTISISAREPNIIGRFGYDDSVIVRVDLSYANFECYLPDAITSRDVALTFFRMDDSGNTLTATPKAGQAILGLTTFTSQYDSFTIVSDGENWLSI
jgi:hypothetical protein